MADKNKVSSLYIIVTGTLEKPYYEILYYDTSDKVWHIGYSSYDLANVVKWKQEYFEVVGEIEDIQPTADVAEVKHGTWQKSQFSGRSGFYSVRDVICSECGIYSTFLQYEVRPDYYCPNCGAKMDGQ